MPLVYYVPEYERDAEQTPLDAERLLRLLGVILPNRVLQTEKDATYRLLQSTASSRIPFTLESSEMEKANQRCCQSFRSLTLRLMNGRSK